MSKTPEFHLSLSGSAPSGESFDVTIYFAEPVLVEDRIEALGKAAHAASRAVYLNPADAKEAGL